MAKAKLPLVTVVTPTWHRHQDLRRCIDSVAWQSYPRVQHIVVSDGPDPELEAEFKPSIIAGHELVVTSLPEHDDNIRWGHRARLHGIDLATGEFIAYLDDDCCYKPDHIERLIDLLIAVPRAGFAYSTVHLHAVQTQVEKKNAANMKVGQAIPAFGQIDTSAIIHRKEILEKATWRYEPGQLTIDWDIVDRWMKADVRWIWDEKATVDYY